MCVCVLDKWFNVVSVRDASRAEGVVSTQDLAQQLQPFQICFLYKKSSLCCVLLVPWYGYTKVFAIYIYIYNIKSYY